jgi:hypothetical protein
VLPPGTGVAGVADAMIKAGISMVIVVIGMPLAFMHYH